MVKNIFVNSVIKSVDFAELVIYYKVISYQIGKTKAVKKMNNIKVNVEKIKRLRKEANISLDKMSELLGYDSPNGYYYLESGRSKFTAEKLASVSRILMIPIDELFFEDEITKMANE